MTRHAQSRMQQRGISAATLDALLELGRVCHVDGGREIVFFDEKAHARLAKAGVLSGSEAHRACKSYAIVESDGAVIKVGHRYRRIPRDRKQK